jgi:hypothetical protein
VTRVVIPVREGGSGEGSAGAATATIFAREGRPARTARGLQDDTGRPSGDVDLRNGRR